MITVFLILACLLLSFFFSGMETGVLGLNRARVRHLRERGASGAGVLLDFLHRPGELSATVLAGNTMVNGVVTVLVAQFFLEEGGPFAAAAAVLIFALFLWVFGDLVPKALFRRFPTRLATRLAPALLVAYVILWPVVKVFAFLTQAVVRLLGGHVSQRQMFVTRDELKLLAREGGQGISLSGEQRNLIATILESHNATVRDVMHPRAEAVTVRADQDVGERCRISAESRFSRLPLESAGGRDAPRWDGLWVAYDVIFNTQGTPRTPPRVDLNTPLDDALLALRKARSPFAFVRDAEGRDVGFLTVEDVLRRYLGKMDL